MRLKLVNPIENLKHEELVEGHGNEWNFLVPMEKSLGQLLQETRISADQLRDVQVSEGSLEDVFVLLTKETK